MTPSKVRSPSTWGETVNSSRVVPLLLAACMLGCSADSTKPSDDSSGSGPSTTTTLVRISFSGAGQIAVRTLPAGLDCTYSGSGTSGTCEASYEPGAALQLTAREEWDGRLMQWSGACEGVINSCTLIVPAASGAAAVVRAEVANASTVTLLTTKMTGLPENVSGDVRLSGGSGVYTLRSQRSQIFVRPGVWTVTVNPVFTASGRLVGSGPASLNLVAGQDASLDITYQPEGATSSVASVSVAPAISSVQVARTVQLTATPKDAAGQVIAGQSVTWSTSNAGIATVSATGMVTGVSAGSATISATAAGKSGTAQVTVTTEPPPDNVVARVTLSPATGTVAIGGTVQLTATARNEAGSVLTGKDFTWTSSNTNVATVSTAGMVVGRAGGVATITATSEGKSGSATVTVTAPTAPVARVTVTPNSASMTLQGTLQLGATLHDAAGNVLSGRPVSWASSNNNVATVSSSGQVTPRAAGTVTITATSEGRSGSAQITVTNPTPPGGQWSYTCSRGATWEGYNCYGTFNGVQFYAGTRWDGINKKYEMLMRIYNGNSHRVWYSFDVIITCANGATFRSDAGSYLAAGGISSSGLWWYPCAANVNVKTIQIASVKVTPA